MAEYEYDIYFFEADACGGDSKQVYLFNGAHSFVEFEDGDASFAAEVEHLEPKDNEPNRVRLKFTLKKR